MSRFHQAAFHLVINADFFNQIFGFIQCLRFQDNFGRLRIFFVYVSFVFHFSAAEFRLDNFLFWNLTEKNERKKLVDDRIIGER